MGNLPTNDPGPAAGDRAGPKRRLRRSTLRRGRADLGRILLLLLLILLLGGAIFLVTWDIPPPTSQVEEVVPDGSLPP